MEHGHAVPWEEVVAHFKTDPERGLSDDQVKRYLEKYGPNGECPTSQFFHQHDALFCLMARLVLILLFFDPFL